MPQHRPPAHHRHAQHPHGGGHRAQGNGRGARHGGLPEPGVTATYNFVPLSPVVPAPPWQAHVSHDRPLREGLCAEFDITVEAHTPLLVGGDRGKDGSVSFHAHADGQLAIPGASLLGMVRNVVEIASFSRIGLMDDRWLSIRDLYAPAYQSRFATRDAGVIKPKTLTGWLRFEQGRWLVHRCEHARVEHSTTLMPTLGVDVQGLYGANNPAHRLVAWKYGLFKQACPGYVVYASQEEWAKGPQPQLHRHSGRTLFYREVTRLSTSATGLACPVQEARLVLTGQPGPGSHMKTGRDGQPRWVSGKHMEFLFAVAPDPAPIEVAPEVWRAFVQTHTPPSGSSDDSALAWHRRQRPFGDLGLPIFYLPGSAGGISAMGLAQMFRLAYPKSLAGYTGQATANAAQPLDFAQTLFGTLDAQRPDAALKGRVSFGDCRLQGQPQRAADAFQRAVVLASPKPTFYPAYVKQDAAGQGLKTLLEPSARLNGWKRYPVHDPERVRALPAPGPDTRDMQTRLQPLAVGSVFRGKVRLHNVTAEEAGAVLWALTWGDRTGLRHALGMGKSLGLGQVSIRTDRLHIRPNAPHPGTDVPGANELMRSFAQWMEAQLQGNGGWLESAQFEELLAMADPAHPSTSQLRSLHFDIANRANNQFANAKREGGQMLPRYSHRLPP